MFLIQIAIKIILFMLKISVAKHTICQVGKNGNLIIIHEIYLVVSTNPSEKWWSESQLGWWHSQYDGKNTSHVPNHQSVICNPHYLPSIHPFLLLQHPTGWPKSYLWCTSASAPPGHRNKPIDSGLSTSRHHLRPLQTSQLSPDWDVDPIVCSWGYSIVQKNTIHIWVWLNILYLIFQRIFIIYQWPVQEPKLEVPTIHKAYFLGLCKRISPQNMAKHMVLTYLHFRILKISHWIYCIEVTIFVGIQTVFRAPHWHYCGTNRVVITHWDSCA